MKLKGKFTSAVLAAVMLAGMLNITAYAANEKITSISLEVENEIRVGEQMDDAAITVEAKSSKYTVSDVSITNSGFEWEASDVPTIEVRVEAADGYYFSILAKNIKIKGATYASGKKESSTSLRLTLKLPSLLESTGEITEAGWEAETVARWTEAFNAASYEVRLYRDDVNIKGIQVTTGTSLDLGSGMTKAGTYTYKVRAVNKINSDKKTKWAEASAVTVDQDMATRMRETYGSPTSGLTEPGEEPQGTLQAGWVKDSKGWWYRNADRSYTRNDWQLIDNKWYYFDSKGYMVTGWVQWKDKWYYCDLSEGHMLRSSLTPDGLRVDSAGVWIE